MIFSFVALVASIIARLYRNCTKYNYQYSNTHFLYTNLLLLDGVECLQLVWVVPQLL